MWNRRCALIFGLLGAALLASCASMPGAPPSIALDYQGPDAGKAVIAIGTTGGGPGTYYYSYTLYFRRIGTGADAPTGAFTYAPGQAPFGDKPDYKLAGDTGLVVTASLPPGDYVITDFRAFTMVGNAAHNFHSKEPLAIPFKVATGKVSYLGRYRATGLRGRNFIGLPLPAGVNWDVASLADTDLAIAKARDPKLVAEVLDQTPKAEAIANPLFKDRKR